jgi:hypothetical protein
MFVVISIKVSMYTNDRTFGKFVTNEGEMNVDRRGLRKVSLIKKIM